MNVPTASRPTPSSAGQPAGANDFRARSTSAIDLSVPTTVNLPASKVMSPEEASSTWPAIFLAFSISTSAAFFKAEPPMVMLREP